MRAVVEVRAVVAHPSRTHRAVLARSRAVIGLDGILTAARGRPDRPPVKRSLIIALSFATALAFFVPAPARAERIHGVTLPPNSSKVDENLYKNTSRFNRVLRYLRNNGYARSGHVWIPIRGNARVTGWHIANQRSSKGWSGINVYQADGKVFIYVLPAKRAAKKKR